MKVDDKGRWELECPAAGLEVGQVVRNDVTGHWGIVKGIEGGIATIRQTNQQELERIDKSYRPRWG